MTVIHRIYGLSGPDMVIRYVGRTTYLLHERATGHLQSSKKGTSLLNLWTAENAETLFLRELERVEVEGSYGFYPRLAIERETWWIGHFLGMGNDLFNIRQRPKNSRCTIIELPEAIESERSTA